MSAFVAYNDPHDQTSDESGRYYPKQRFPFRLYLHSMFSDLNLKVWHSILDESPPPLSLNQFTTHTPTSCLSWYPR